MLKPRKNMINNKNSLKNRLIRLMLKRGARAANGHVATRAMNVASRHLDKR